MEVGAATLEASTLSFPATPSGVTATVMRTTLTNTGNKELTLTAVALSGANATEFAEQRRHDLRGRDEAGRRRIMRS